MFYDVADPAKPLAPPEEFTDPLQLFNTVSDLLSPTAWVSEVLDVVFGFNPLERATEAFAVTAPAALVSTCSGSINVQLVFLFGLHPLYVWPRLLGRGTGAPTLTPVPGSAPSRTHVDPARGPAAW